MTYPIKGHPWRRNPVRLYEFRLTPEEATELFNEVATMRERHPGECLDNEALWSDQSEQANAITRHATTGKLCHTIAIYLAGGEAAVYFAMEEDSAALCESRLYRTVTALTAPFEVLPAHKAKPDAEPESPSAEAVRDSAGGIEPKPGGEAPDDDGGR
jgi:hypothetical protein